MSAQVSRRQLFGFLRQEPKKEAGFSLESFYQNRATPQAPPPFAVRPTDGSIPTTSVGTPTPQAPPPPWARPPVATLAGTPRVRPHACLAYRGFCSVCAERCPVEGALLVEHGHPRVIPEACTRCGACVSACPAPINGFEIIPEEPPHGR